MTNGNIINEVHITIDIRVVNVIASTKLDQQIPIEVLHEKLSHVQYDPEIFPGLIYRRKNPKATIIMFSTGKITSIGTRSEKEAIRSIQVTVDDISSIIGSSRFPPPKIENIVAVADTKKHLDFDKVLHLLGNAVYKARRYAALIYKTNKGTILIFESGKIVCAGAKGEKDAKQAIEKLHKILKKI